VAMVRSVAIDSFKPKFIVIYGVYGLRWRGI
jgi:hypothetical protein